MDGHGAVRAAGAPLALAVATTIGVVLLSGSDQPVTAHPLPHWQELPAPPLTPRAHALGVYARHRILVQEEMVRTRMRLDAEQRQLSLFAAPSA